MGGKRGVCMAKGACMAKGDMCGEGGMHGEGGMCGKGGMHDEGGACVVKGGVHGIRQVTINEWAVRILLECILEHETYLLSQIHWVPLTSNKISREIYLLSGCSL